jgi:hypothetical protein
MSTPRRYELAWHYIWEGYNDWKKEVITNYSDSRQGKALSKEFGREVAILAESDSDIPIAKSNRKPIKKIKQQPSGVK